MRTDWGDRLPVWALGSALPLPLASLPFFAVGYWDKAEPMLVWFHLCGALAWLAVTPSLLRRDIPPVVGHPIVIAPLAVAAWSLAAAAFVPHPLLSLLGSPQSGFGALWFADLSGFCACALLAARRPGAWRWLLRWAAAITLAVALIKTRDWFSLREGGTTWLLFVPSYYGWLGLALAPLAAALPREARGERLALLAVAGLAALTSLSAAAMVLLAFGAAYVFAAKVWRERSWVARATTSRWRMATWTMIASILPWLLLHALPALQEKESLKDRFLVGGMIERAIGADPRLFWGHGWGRTQDALQAWQNSAGQRLWNPDWTFLYSDYFHSHDWAPESLYAIGVPGMLLVLAGFLALPCSASARQRSLAGAFSIALAAFHGVWFQLCLSLPLMAMACAQLADPEVSLIRPRRFALPLPPLLAAAGIAASLALLTFALHISGAITVLDRNPPVRADLPADFRGEDLAAAELIRDRLARFGDRARTEPTAPIAAAALPLLDFIDERAPDTTTVLLLTTGLTAMAQIHVTGELAFMAAPEQILRWRRWLDRLLTLAPGRTDQAIPYLTAAIAAHQWDEVSSFSRHVLERNSDDPVGLHYGGLAMLATAASDRQREAGLSMLRRAVAAGIELDLPLDPALKRMLQGVP